MNKSEKYSEIILLGQMLQERKIERVKARESPR
jgi:hypothetical protein